MGSREESVIRQRVEPAQTVIGPRRLPALLVDQYKRAQEAAGKTVIDWIIENGGQILVDLFIGGIKACLNDPGIVNCILGAIDLASLGLVAFKACEVAPRTAEVMAELEARFNRRVAAQGGQAQRSREVQEVL
jgi:hypothetical protein